MENTSSGCKTNNYFDDGGASSSIDRNDNIIENINPIIALNLKRQRCVFTATSNPLTKFNVSATPFISSQTFSPIQRENFNQNLLRPQSTPNFQNNFSMFQPIRQTASQLEIPPAIVRSPSTPRYENHQNYYNNDMYSQAQNLMSMQVLSSPCSRIDSTKPLGPVVLPNGIIQLSLRDDIRIDITLDKAIRVFNCRSQIIIALSNNNGTTAALVHPNGRVYQVGSCVEIMAHDGMRKYDYIRYAKMWQKGISFTGENCALTYIVDSGGTRTTTDTFSDLTNDLPSNVFYQNSRYGPEYTDSLLSVLHNSSYWCNDDGTETYDINDFRLSQSADGMIKITRPSNKCLIRTSPGNGSATITTPFLHCTASLGQTSHLFVRRGEHRMHFDGSSFVVRNAGHSAGFDETNLLIVY